MKNFVQLRVLEPKAEDSLLCLKNNDKGHSSVS